MAQYPLLLTLPTIFSADNFFVSDCNREAWQAVSAWPDWSSHALLICGPRGSGKSHLGQIWAERAGAYILTANEPDKEPDNHHWLIEDIEQFEDERKLLHWFNYTRENKRNLLLTSSVLPPQLPFILPDLTSRLLAIPYVSIHDADDEALLGAMRKQFSDRQMKVADDVIAYLLPRMDRSFAAVIAMVEKLDKAALAERRTLTIPFVKRLLES